MTSSNSTTRLTVTPWYDGPRQLGGGSILPKFSYSASYGLTSTPGAVEVTLPFLAGQANFSGIDGQQDLNIAKVLHEAYVSVQETGTTAVTATNSDYSHPYRCGCDWFETTDAFCSRSTPAVFALWITRRECSSVSRSVDTP